MYNPKTCLHNFDQGMKEWIETKLYSKAAAHGIIDTNPIILCGPAARRTDTLARNTGVVGRQGVTYVEMHRETYTSIREQLSDKIEYNYARIEHTHTANITRSSRFIDMDMTGNSNQKAGQDFTDMLKKQQQAFPDELKAIIFTFSIRFRGLINTLTDLNNILATRLKDKLTCTSIDHLHNPDNVQNWYTAHNVSCRQYTFEAEPAKSDRFSWEPSIPAISIKDTLCYYYNTGGGNMLTGIIIYK